MPKQDTKSKTLIAAGTNPKAQTAPTTDHFREPMPQPTSIGDGTIAIFQTTLVRRKLLKLRHPAIHLSLGRIRQLPVLLCVCQDKLLVYNLRELHHPRLVNQLSIPGVAGACHFQQGFAIWGKSGAAYYPVTENLTAQAPQQLTPMAIAAGEVRHCLCIVTPPAILVFDAHLRRTAELKLPTQAAKYFCTFGKLGVVSDGNTAWKIEQSPQGELKLSTRYALKEHTGIANPNLIISDRSDLYVSREGTPGSMVKLPSNSKAMKIATYPESPWFENTVKYGQVFARRSADGLIVSIEEALPTVALKEHELRAPN